MTRKLHDRKNFLKDEYIIWKNIFHVRFVTMNFSEKKSEAVNIMKTEQILLKIKKYKRSETRLNMKLKNYKKISIKCLICDTREHSLSECWQIFKKLKSEKMKLSVYHIHQTKKIMKDDKKLTAKMQKIY